MPAEDSKAVPVSLSLERTGLARVEPEEQAMGVIA